VPGPLLVLQAKLRVRQTGNKIWQLHRQCLGYH